VRSADEQWALLLQELRARYDVSEPAPGRVLVSNSGRHQPPRRVELVMTPEQFDDIVAVPYGSLGPAIDFVLHQLATQPGDTPYLVYRTYDLVPSDTPELPPPLDGLREFMEEHPGERFTISAFRPGDPRRDEWRGRRPDLPTELPPDRPRDRGGDPQSGPPPRG
jgi:hypothetical protein